MSRVAAPITVTADDARRLNAIIDNPETPEDVKKRCRAILLAGEGMQNKAIAKKVHVRENTAGDWRKAWISGGVSGILSIAKTGRPKGKKRVEFEESIRNEESKDLDPDALAKRIGISKPTMYRALRDINTAYDDQSLDDIRQLSAPGYLDIVGLFIATDEAAIILRMTTQSNQHAADGHLFTHDPNVRALFSESDDNSIKTDLLDCLDILAQHTVRIDSDARQNQTLNGFLCALVPNIPSKDGDEYYVIYSSTHQMQNLPAGHCHLHYMLVQSMDRLEGEVHFWMDALSSGTDYADRFRNALRGYISVRPSSAEAFRWCSCDIAMTEYMDNRELDSSVFDDPSVKNVMVTTTRIYDRSGPIIDITHKEINVVPELEDISFSDLTSANASLGMIDDGIAGFFRTVGGEAVQQYYATAVKKNGAAKVAEVEAETENGRLKVVIPKSLKKLLTPKQRLWAPRVRRMVNRQLIHTAYAPATDLMNDYLRRDGSSEFSVMSLYEVLQQDGEAREVEDQEYMASVFSMTEWINKSGIVTDPEEVPEAIRFPHASEEDKKYIQSKVEEARQSFNEGRPEEEQLKYESVIDALEYLPRNYVFVMADSILIPRQKDHRNVNGITDTIRGSKYVSLANATIICAEGTFAFTAVKEEDVMKKVLAFLIDNNLLENRGLAFFADGATSLKTLAKKYFGFRDYDYYLDWYHLWKKCYEYFSMALYGGKKNRERNNKIRYEFFKRLWAGNIEEAVAYLRSLDEKIVKSQSMLEAIISYISDENKKRDQIYGYALRKELGLINSSNRVEKQNDVDLAERCKDCASSWTDDGALHMAQSRLLFYQKQDRATADQQGWYQTRQLSYKPVPLSEDLKKKMWIAA